ncbi:UNKNOWN [Stylonychia lemnae]|uniref:Uncharacterized protein n=1 Tax=Stylonychia lemnae TaxID=5949 RepID=A0A078BBM3_STYLE|nr:UNKNOWN [Stylonychia lemnae]|eukprot:CDW91794.1 UNKNOWN [Stylonychia lemnae]
MRQTALKLVICAFAVSAIAANESWELRGDAYQAKSAEEKHDIIWNKVTADETSQAWKGAAGLAGFVAESMAPTLDWVADSMPTGFFGKREKYIHTQGVVGSVKFVPVPNNEGYTGIFQGAEYGIIRFSTGGQADETKKDASQAQGNFAPGFGLKFLRDGIVSADMVALSITQESWNFFKNDFSNHVGVAPGIVGTKFRTVTQYINHIGISDMARYNEKGQDQSAQLKFPFQLLFSAPNELKSRFPDNFEKDFTDQLITIPQGSTLFNVYALADPKAEKVLIGHLELNSEITRSMFGDTMLFFEHQNGAQDIDIKPEWKSAFNLTSQKISVKNGIACPLNYLKQYVKDSIQQIQQFI